jgi:hypothetical protein
MTFIEMKKIYMLKPIYLSTVKLKKIIVLLFRRDRLNTVDLVIIFPRKTLLKYSP